MRLTLEWFAIVLDILKVRSANHWRRIYAVPGFLVGGYTYLAHFPDSSNEILLATNIYCTTTDEKIQDCSISHYTPPSSCDVLDIVAVRCHSK